MLGLDDNEVNEILLKLGRSVGFEHMATMARQVAHENAKPAPKKKKEPKVKTPVLLRTGYVNVELTVKVDFFRGATDDGLLLKQLTPTHFEAWGWEDKDKDELQLNIAQHLDAG